MLWEWEFFWEQKKKWKKVYYEKKLPNKNSLTTDGLGNAADFLRMQ